jgi:hypothetical protein
LGIKQTQYIVSIGIRCWLSNDDDKEEDDDRRKGWWWPGVESPSRRRLKIDINSTSPGYQSNLSSISPDFHLCLIDSSVPIMNTAKTERSRPRDAGERPWHSYITIDLTLAAAQRSILHPYVAWMVPLGLRAQAMDYDNPIMRNAILYASFLTLVYIFVRLDRRIAFGQPREVNLDEEVIAITGGAGGLGLLLAEIYSLRGASVAILDIREPEKGLGENVQFYKCDVGNEEAVKKAFQQIKQDVGIFNFPLDTEADIPTV